MSQYASPYPLSEWLHTNGRRYAVLCIANEKSTFPEKYPVTVIYQDQDENIWATPLERWYEMMTAIRP